MKDSGALERRSVGPRQVALDLASEQHGIVARRHLLKAGLPRTTIDRQVGSLLFRLFPGVYAVGRPQIGQDALWLAGVLAAGEGAALAGRSAASAWGFLSVTPGVEVLRCGNRWRVRRSIDVDGRIRHVPLIVRRIRWLPAEDIRVLRGTPLVCAARVLQGLAPGLSREGFRRAFFEADRLGLLPDEDLARCLATGQGRPGAGAFRLLAQDRIPDLRRAKSLLEGLMLDACHQASVQPPEVNVVIGVHEVDCVWRKQRVAVELDSYGFHRGLEKFEEDLVRNNRLWSQGWVLLRYTWRRVTREPDQVIEEVRSALLCP